MRIMQRYLLNVKPRFSILSGGCEKLEQDQAEDTRLLAYPPTPACNELHCECGTNVSISCDSKTHKLSGSRWMQCHCEENTMDAFWQYENGSISRCSKTIRVSLLYKKLYSLKSVYIGIFFIEKRHLHTIRVQV